MGLFCSKYHFFCFVIRFIPVCISTLTLFPSPAETASAGR